MIIGIEICADTLRAVCFDRFRAGRHPAQTLEVPLDRMPQGTAAADGALTKSVRRLIRELQPGKSSVAVAVPSAWCSFRTVSFPYRSPSRVEKTLQYALADRLPNPMESYVIEPAAGMMPSGAQGARLSVAVCPAESVRNLLAALSNAGVEPCIVQPAVVSLARCVQLTLSPEANEAILVVRAGLDECEIGWMRNGELLACRVLRLPNHGPVESDHVEVVAEKIVSVIRMNEISDGSVEFKRILVLASGEKDDALAHALEQRLDRRAEILQRDLLDGTWAAAWGVAAEAATRKQTAPNLRRGAHSYRPYARRMEHRIVAALALAIGILCLLGVHTVRGLFDARGRLETIRNQQSLVFKAVGGVGKPSLDQMQSIVAEAENAAEEARRNEIVSCLLPWRELMDLAPEPGRMRFELIDINQSRTSIKAVVHDRVVATDFERRLRRSDMFMSDPHSVLKKSGPQERRLTMDLMHGLR